MCSFGKKDVQLKKKEIIVKIIKLKSYSGADSHHFQNVSGTQEVDFVSAKYYLGSTPHTPLEAFAFGTCLENRSPFILDPRLLPIQGNNLTKSHDFI